MVMTYVFRNRAVIHFFVFCFIIMPDISVADEDVVKGTYVSAFERSDFMPCKGDEHWWLSGNVFAKIETFIAEHHLRKPKANWEANRPVYIEVKGLISEKGRWGHLGMYQREIHANELLAINTLSLCPDTRRSNRLSSRACIRSTPMISRTCRTLSRSSGSTTRRFSQSRRHRRPLDLVFGAVTSGCFTWKSYRNVSSVNTTSN